jgi:hypothetical protein
MLNVDRQNDPSLIRTMGHYVTNHRQALVFIVNRAAAFYAVRYYAVFRFGQHLGECSTPAEPDIVGSAKASGAEKYAICSRVYSYIFDKQE